MIGPATATGPPTSSATGFFARDDRPGDRDESANLVRDRIAWPALPYFHGGSVSLLHDRRKLQNRLMMTPYAEWRFKSGILAPLDYRNGAYNFPVGRLKVNWRWAGAR
jgi:hypothetical protein